MKRTNTIIAAFLVLAMVVSVIPMTEAGAPAIETNAVDTNILINNVTASPATVGQGGTVNITCDVTANGAVAISYVNLTVTDPANTTHTYTMITNTSDANGNGTYWNATAYSVAGVYHYTINVTDANGNWNISGNNTFTVTDTTAPTISDVSVTPSAVVEGNAVTISANVTDNVAVSSVKLTVKKATTVGNNTTYTVVINATDMTNSNGIYTYVHTYGVGTYVFEIEAKDAANNSALDNSTNNTFEVTADTSAPVISNVAAEPTTVAQGGSVNITADVTDAGVGVDTVMVNITYPDGTFRNETMTLYNGTYAYNTTYMDIGTYSYFIWANDTNGNAASSTLASFEITDGTAPVISDVSVIPDKNIVNITAIVTDNIGVDSVTVTIFNSTGDVLAGYPMDMTETNTTTHTYAFTSEALPLGNYTFVINAADAAGNPAVPATGSFSIVDTEAPEISDINVPANIVEHQNVTITCVVTDNVNDVADISVVIIVDGTSHAMTYSGQNNVFEYTISDIVYGDHSFTITATDAEGNSATSPEETFSAADASNPEIDDSVSSIPTSVTLGEDIKFSVAIHDDDPMTVTLYYSVDGGNETSVVMTQDADGNYVATIKVDSGSKLTYRIVANDGQSGATTVAQGEITLNEKSTISTTMLAGIGILLLVIIIAVVMMMKKKPSAAAAPSEEEPVEEAEEEPIEEEEFEEISEEEDDLGEDL